MNADREALVTVSNLCLTAHAGGVDTEILRDISFTVRRGERWGIIGASGAGKSMTLAALSGLLPEKGVELRGSVRFGEVDPYALPLKARGAFLSRHVAVVLQDAQGALNPYETIGRQLTDTIRRHRDPDRRAARARASELLETLGLSGGERLLRAYPHQLSGGMRQRIAIALSLEGDAKLMLADEPTAALDAMNQMRLLEVLDALCRERSLALLYVSHHPATVDRLCDHVLVFESGRIVERGETGAVFSNPRHDCTRSLIRETKALYRRPDDVEDA